MKKCVIGFVEESRARDVDDAGCITKKKPQGEKLFLKWPLGIYRNLKKKIQWNDINELFIFILNIFFTGWSQSDPQVAWWWFITLKKIYI
jgi:hypothetical protein